MKRTIWSLLTLALALAVSGVSCAAATPTPTPASTATPIFTASPALTPTPAPTPTLTSEPMATFDFDTGLPALAAGQSTPFDQTSGGITAHFSSPADPAAFSVQNRNTVFYTLSQFSANYLSDNNPFANALEIEFTHELSAITLTFATTDYHGVGEVEHPTEVKLTAYSDSTGTTAVGSVTARGSFSSDPYPQGTLTLSPGQPFKLVRIELVPQPMGATYFMVDNIRVTR